METRAQQNKEEIWIESESLYVQYYNLQLRFDEYQSCVTHCVYCYIALVYRE